MSRANLRPVPDTGELPADGPQTLGEALMVIGRQEDVIAGLERDIRGWAARYQELKRDKEAEARESDLWPEAERLFAVWRKATGRSRCRFSVDRFWLVEPFLRKDGFERCAQAIIGRAFDHFTGTRSNGTAIHYHEWERVFGGRGDFEESANRIPKDWRERLARFAPAGATAA